MDMRRVLRTSPLVHRCLVALPQSHICDLLGAIF